MLLSLILYLLLKGLLLGLGIGLGFLLHWMLPEVGLGIAILTGVLTTSVAIAFFTWIHLRMGEMDEDEDWDESALPRVFITPGTLPKRRSRRRRKPPR